jgi:hypothetical protein
MRRRDFIALLGSAAAASPFETHAQLAIPATARVGVLTGASISTPSGARFRKAFVEALRRHGWEEGRNLLIEVRASEGRPERYAQLAAELVASNVDVAVGSGYRSRMAGKGARDVEHAALADGDHDRPSTRGVAVLIRPCVTHHGEPLAVQSARAHPPLPTRSMAPGRRARAARRLGRGGRRARARA